jgi:hypothetical protein
VSVRLFKLSTPPARQGKQRQSSQVSLMSCIDRIESAQAKASSPAITPNEAIALAGKRFYNLCSEGIKPRKFQGTPIDPEDVATAMAFLARCRKTRKATTHTCDLVPLIGVPLGAIIAGAVGLGFEVVAWRGIRVFEPGAMMNVGLRLE